MYHRILLIATVGVLFGIAIVPTAVPGQTLEPLISGFDTVLGIFHPDYLENNRITRLSPEVVERLGVVTSSLQAAAAQEIANLSISSAGTQYFFGRDRMFYISGNLGTYFIEPPWTNGRGNGSIGINTAYLDFETFQDQPLSDIYDFYNDAGMKTIDGDYDLTGWLTSVSFTYGFTERLDVGVIVPLVRLEGQGSFEYTLIEGLPPVADFSETVTDVADIFLRLKYELLEVEDMDELFCWTAGLDVKFDNGDKRKLLGTGDMGFRIRTSVGKRFGPFYPTAELAYNFAGVDARASMNIFDENAANQLVTVSTGIEDDDFNAFEFRLGLPVALIEDRWTVSAEWLQSNSDFAVVNDLGISTRFSVRDQLYIQGGIRIPLDDEGLRTDFISSIGCEYRF